MSEWQDISSAPKDGTKILVYSKIWPEIGVASYQDPKLLSRGWRLHPLGDNDDCEPTHWMPLPNPPGEG